MSGGSEKGFASIIPLMVSSLQVPDLFQQRTGGRIPEPLLRVSAGPGMAILLLSLQQEMSIFLLVSLGAKPHPS